MAKPIKSSLRKTGVATWCVKVVEDALSLFLVWLESTWNSCPTYVRFVSTTLVRILAKRKEKFPFSPLWNSLFEEPKFETIRSSEAVDIGRPEGRRCGLGCSGESNGLSSRHKEDFKPERTSRR